MVTITCPSKENVADFSSTETSLALLSTPAGMLLLELDSFGVDIIACF